MIDNDDDSETLLVSEACLQKWKLVDGFWILLCNCCAVWNWLLS